MTLALGPQGFSLLGSGGGVSQVMRTIATRGVGPSGIIKLGGSGDSNYTRFESRLLHYSGADPITAIQVTLAAYYMASAGGEADLPNAYTGFVAIEYSGQVKIITWDGGANSKLVPVSPRGFYTSDLTSLGFTIPANTAFFVQTGATVANSGEFVYATDTRAAGTTNDTFFRSTAAVSQVGTAGPWTTPSGGANNNLGGCYTPITIMAYRSPSAKAAVLLGDSILAYTGDTSGDGNGNAGYPARACYLADGTNKLPYSKLGRPSETASNMVGTKGAVRRSLLAGHSILVSEFGMNDLGQASSTVTTTPQDKTAAIANLKDNYINAIWGPARAAGLKVYQCKITPRVKGSNITSLTAVGTTCTATVKTGHAVPTNGGTYVIEGASPSQYNGTVTITSVTGQQFTYTASVAPGSSPATIGTGFGTIHVHDNYTTQTFQQPDDGYEPGGLLRDVINAWFDTQVGVTIDGVLDPNPGIEFYNAGVPQGTFITAGGARTADGLHPNGTGASGAASQIAAALYAAA